MKYFCVVQDYRVINIITFQLQNSDYHITKCYRIIELFLHSNLTWLEKFQNGVMIGITTITRIIGDHHHNLTTATEMVMATGMAMGMAMGTGVKKRTSTRQHFQVLIQ